MRSLIVAVVVMGFVLASLGNVAAAQPNDRRRDFVEGVLRVLVETQVLPHLAPDGQPPQAGPVPRPATDPRYRDARAAVEEYSAYSGELIATLRQEERACPELRPLLGDAIAVKAMTDALLRRTEVQPDITLLATGFSAVDQHWRTLATRLERSLAVSAGSRQCVRQLNSCGGRACQKLGISPQMDQEQIVQLLATLTGHLRGLLDAVAGARCVTRQPDPADRRSAVADAGQLPDCQCRPFVSV